MHAAKLRLRPIIMTTPWHLVLVSCHWRFQQVQVQVVQHSVGYGVLGSVLSSTLLGIFFIPVFFVWIRSIFKYKPKNTQIQEHKS